MDHVRGAAEAAIRAAAAQVCSAAGASDAAALLRLYAGAPRMAPYLMDHLLERVRVRALAAARAAFQPGVPLALLAGQLGFDSEGEVR